MAAASSPNNSSNTPTIHSFSNGFDPDTTFVQADPENFRAIVQRLTGAGTGTPSSGENGHRRPAFNLHKRRPTARKLEMIKLHNENGGSGATAALHSLSLSARNHRSSLGEHTVVYSPVSPLEYEAARGSPAASTTTEEEERAIAAKGFYFHRSPINTPAGSDPPELLQLFPLYSHRENYD
ncbi:hypothetical protein C2S53_019541 [Perilla frutescens var. hirtella]|uniref:VQ domain-containing protein n=1 Tax=Perilla frutescens var. hirtella TaxID=608512 RepID=A0AAD4ILT7_PERFH|nr:hypothetical protein C2S53_019541 [Perilla frutescens var. hirtella]